MEKKGKSPKKLKTADRGRNDNNVRGRKSNKDKDPKNRTTTKCN